MEDKQKLECPIQRIVKLSEEENNLIKRKIEESFFSNLQNFALHLLIQEEIRHASYSELNRLATEAHKTGIDINQMARPVNQFHKIPSEDIKGLTDKAQSLNTLVQSELNKLIKRRDQL